MCILDTLENSSYFFMLMIQSALTKWSALLPKVAMSTVACIGVSSIIFIALHPSFIWKCCLHCRVPYKQSNKPLLPTISSFPYPPVLYIYPWILVVISRRNWEKYVYSLSCWKWKLQNYFLKTVFNGYPPIIWFTTAK